jgi:hypothetical protein
MPTFSYCRRWVISIVTVSLLGLVVGAQEGGRLNSNLTATLNAFAKENGLSNEQLRGVLGEYVLNSRSIPKGGVGTIGEDESYVVLDGKDNAVLIGGKKWTGKDSKRAELVVVGDGRVIGAVDASGISNVKIIFFNPSQVRYVDLSNNSGASYPRHIESQPAK